MRADKARTEHIKPGSIMQISPKAELAAGNGALVRVVDKSSWGCNVQLPDGNIIPVAWSHLEDTGGSALWDGAGVKLREPESTLKHHP